MVHKDTDIIIEVVKTRPETPGHTSVIFERPRNFNYEAGDWIDIEPVGSDLAGGKTYSLSSAPTEPQLMITFKQGVSPLKRALAAAVPGDKLRIIQYGNDYGFQLEEDRSNILIAGGVGVAPFRSMLQEMADTGSKSRVRLIYLNQNEDFLFKAELDEWERALPNVTIAYLATKELKRKQRLKAIEALIGGSIRQHYYLAGPPAMVESMSTHLRILGVDGGDIKIDSFGGY